MTLFVMSAFVAFNGFPGQDVEGPIGNLVLQERPAPVSIPDVVPVATRPRSATTRAAARHRSLARDAEGPKASTGLIKHRASAPTQAPAAQAPGSSQSALPVQQSAPQLPSAAVPSLPGASAPNIQLPVLQAPDASQQPLVDTKAITGLLTGQ
jgi:hypothetical protein